MIFNLSLYLFQYIATVPATYTIEVKAIAKTNSPKKVHVVGCTDDKYKELEAGKDMMADLLDLQDPNNEVTHMNEFVPFTMKVTTEGIKITMMEIPPENTPQPHNSNGTHNASSTHTTATTAQNNPLPQPQKDNDGHTTDEYDDQ